MIHIMIHSSSNNNNNHVNNEPEININKPYEEYNEEGFPSGIIR